MYFKYGLFAMIPGFEKIVEERIRMAQRKGEFDDLPGAGKPLAPSDDALAPQELRLAYKMLKNAGYVPPVVELKKEIVDTEALLEQVESASEAYGILKKLNFLVMKLNTLRKGSAEFDVPQQYYDKIVQRFDKKATFSPDNKS